jgi:hypothetical protein
MLAIDLTGKRALVAGFRTTAALGLPLRRPLPKPARRSA